MAEENRLTDIRTVRELLSRHGFHFSKAMGQNFLVNPTVCPRMAEACGASPETGVLEIGPGIGVLTRELAARAGRVVAVELDERLLPVLRETLAGRENIEVVQGDILKLPLDRLLEEKFTRPDGTRMPVAVCANLPYYITSPIIMLLLESRLPFTSLTVMVQKEAADRLCAAPGTRECGAVSLAVQYYARAEKLFGVSRGSFMPAPNVDSAVIRLTVHALGLICDIDAGAVGGDLFGIADRGEGVSQNAAAAGRPAGLCGRGHGGGGGMVADTAGV